MSYMQLGEKENARKCLEPVTASTMVHPLDMMYKRRVLLYKGEIPLEEYLEGVEGDAGTHDITELFGAANYCYHVRGDTKRAIDLLDELLAIPTHHHAWGYKMAVLYRDSWAKQL